MILFKIHKHLVQELLNKLLNYFLNIKLFFNFYHFNFKENKYVLTDSDKLILNKF